MHHLGNFLEKKIKNLPQFWSLQKKKSLKIWLFMTRLTKLSKEQADYISVGVEGPFKPNAYRY